MTKNILKTNNKKTVEDLLKENKIEKGDIILGIVEEGLKWQILPRIVSIRKTENGFQIETSNKNFFSGKAIIHR